MTAPADGPDGSPPPRPASSNSPWGGGGDDEAASDGGDGGSGAKGGRRDGSPWLPPRGGSGNGGTRRPQGLDDLLKRGPFGPQLPRMPGGRGLWGAVAGGIAALWIATTSIHILDAGEEGVVTRLGSYSRTLQPGLALTFPAPIERVDKVVLRERQVDIPGNNAQNLVLTGDANIINLGYRVRWNVRDAERYLFQVNDPDNTVKDAAESAMRATIANFSLAQALTSGRSEIEAQVQRRLQAILDRYGSGIRVVGVSILASVPPTEVEDAFNEVNAAQQQAEGFQNSARADAQRIVQRAQGDAAEFDLIYEQYRLAPEVTRRRLYYETMERVLRPAEKTVVQSGGTVPYLALPDARRRPPAPTPQPAAPAAGANR